MIGPILRDWTDALRAQQVPFDAVGLSCYQQAAEGDLIAQGLNAAEAPGGAAKRRTYGVGGRYEGNGFLGLYREIATAYGLR